MKPNGLSCGPCDGSEMGTLPSGEEIVVSGLAGKFPNSDNVYELRENLFNKIDLVTINQRGTVKYHEEIPPRSGMLNDLDKMDAGFFGMNSGQAEYTDAVLRQMLEQVVAALLDAGVNPATLAGTNTGVYVALSEIESEAILVKKGKFSKGEALLGCMQNQTAQRISYHLQLNGPSFTCDAACGSSGYALELAYREIKMGKCDQAIVGAASTCLLGSRFLQFVRLGVISLNGVPKVFDEDANGYVRSETISAILLQKAKDAKRMYCRMVHAKVNSDGYKLEGITSLLGTSHAQFYQEFYEECKVNPSTISFVEAHATGTRIGDPEEVFAIASVFCKNREKPLLMGSIKSNMGHSEPASGLCSLAKVIIAMETGYIPPNINLRRPKREITALHDGRINVVIEKTPWINDERLAAMNNFGFGGANSHLLLAANKKIKINDGQPSDDLPRLVCVSGRTTEAINTYLDDIKSRKLDAEYIGLYHEIFCKEVINDKYRGFSIVDKNGELIRSVNAIFKRKPICLMVNDFDDKEWLKIGKALRALPIFDDALKRTHTLLQQLKPQKGFTLEQNNEKKNDLDELFEVTAIQTCIYEVMVDIGFQPDYLMGNNLGELFCAYYDGLLTLEQLLMATYHVKVSRSKFHGSKQEESKLISFSKTANNLSKLMDLKRFKVTKWIRNRVSSKSTLLDALLNPFEAQDASRILSDETLLIHFGLKAPAFVKSLHLIDFGVANTVFNLLTNLGRLYENGVNLNLAKLYPEIKWPVSRGTPMISPLVKWEYNHEWYVIDESRSRSVSRSYGISTKNKNWAFLKGHIIDGSILFPAAGYLYLVWKFVAEQMMCPMENCVLVFDNVKFLHASNISHQDYISYTVSVTSNGGFEVTDEELLLVTGNVTAKEESCNKFTNNVSLDIENNENQIPLLQKDVYKELHLRGYNYTGAFRGLTMCNNSRTTGLVRWDDNWVAFIDNVLQINILQTDTKKLFIPTGIGKMILNPKKHGTFVNSDGTVNVYCRKEANITICGGIEIVGLSGNQISKRKTLTQPVLESYEFVPNEGALQLDQCMRVNVQIILENIHETKFKMVEVLYNGTEERKPLSPIIQSILADQPLMQPEIKLLSNEQLNLPEIIVENEPLSANGNCLLVVGVDLLTDTDMLTQAMRAVTANGFIITRQDRNFKFDQKPENLEIITCYETEFETIVLLKTSSYQKPKILSITDSIQDVSWVPKLQQMREVDKEVVIVSQNVECSGVLGFINCLRRERDGSKIRCVLLKDNAAKFDVNAEFYERQLKKGMAINIYKNGKWGTYRHVLINPKTTEAESVFLSVLNPGDLSSLTWVEGAVTMNSPVDKDKVFAHIYYSALNFRDILTASGRIPIDYGVTTRVFREGLQGWEFAGRDTKGKRIFGVTSRGALASFYLGDSHMVWDIPDQWTMAEAVTIPITYATVLYALVCVAGIRKGQSILIHGGSGGVGQAAINVASYFDCTIFTTVGSKEKKSFILKNFPQINEEHIGNSRDTTFEQMIFQHTNGQGVDIALNSLVQDRLHATVRCIAKGGFYLEIGKTDLINNERLSLQMFERRIKAAAVMLDSMDAKKRRKIGKLVTKYINLGVVKPLQKVTYNYEDIEAAYRFMASGKHIGKIIIKIREEEEKGSVILPTKQLIKCKPVFYCNPNSTYVIIGGLGGVGLELADWLIVKGCQKLILVSRHGLRNGYQALKFRFWEKYASVIHVSTEDVTTREGCTRLLTKANEFGSVDAIFNLAVELKDELFENQTTESFMTSLKPKAIATHHLDIVSRKICPNLRYFVVFSSVSAGRGNQGQTNYGLANSIMENICEKRRSEGFPALAVQWGAIGDVGLVAEMNELNREVVIGGTLPQRISNCLEVLDGFLCQDKVVLSSMVVAEKTIGSNMEEMICNILGVTNLENVDQQLTFPEFGMDSIMRLEIKQVIERHLEVTLTAQDVKTMSFSKLKERTQISIPTVETDWLSFLLRYLEQTHTSHMPSVVLNANDKDNEEFPEVSFLPGIEGTCTALRPLISRLKCRANVCQFLFSYRNGSIKSLAEDVLKYVKRNNSTFTLVAYSFGCIVAMEVIALLEAEGYFGKAIFIDGSTIQLKFLVKNMFPDQNEETIKSQILLKILQTSSFVVSKQLEEELASHKSVDDKINYILTKVNNKEFSSQYLRDCYDMIYNRIRAISDYECSFKKLKSRVKLFKSKTLLYPVDDSTTSDLFENPVEIKMYDGDHENILKNNNLINDINAFILQP